MCFLCVFMCKNVLGREEKSAENIQIERKTQKSPFFGLEVIGAFYNLSTLYEVKGHHLQMISDQVDLDGPIKILTSCF